MRASLDNGKHGKSKRLAEALLRCHATHLVPVIFTLYPNTATNTDSIRSGPPGWLTMPQPGGLLRASLPPATIKSTFRTPTPMIDCAHSLPLLTWNVLEYPSWSRSWHSAAISSDSTS